jgi:hypothetical protein
MPIDPILTQMSQAFRLDQMQFVADRVFPVVETDKDAGTYATYTRAYWLRSEVQVRAYGTKHARGGYPIGSDTFVTVQYSLEHPIPDEIAATALDPIDLEADGVDWLVQQFLIKRETTFASNFMTTGVWTTDATTTHKWSDYSQSDPVNDINSDKRTLLLYGVPKRDIVLVMGQIVWDKLENHPDVIDRLKYVEMADAATIRGAMISIFDVRDILVSSAPQNTGAEGGTETLAFIIDDDCLLCHSPPGATPKTACAGKTLVWPDGGGISTMYRWRDEPVESDILRMKMQYDQKLVTADAGVFRADVVD